jgi:hypothetical protein
VSRTLVAANAALAVLALVPAFAATVVSSLLGRGGTIIVAARRPATGH